MQSDPDAREALQDWYDLAKRADWSSVAEVRRLFAAADGVALASGASLTVLNVTGNRYRVVVATHHSHRQVFMLRLLTHVEDDAKQGQGQL